jgi:hypothetical protein
MENNNNNGCVSFIVLEINKQTTKLIAKTHMHIIGIGKTDYTIHRC